MEAAAAKQASRAEMQRGKGIFEAIMTLQSPEYWYKRLAEMKEFGIRLRHVNDMLLKYPADEGLPQDYSDLKHELQKALKQNHLNLLWIRQEIAIREELQDYPGAATNAK